MPFARYLRKSWGAKRKWKCEKCGVKWSDGWLLEFHHILPTSAGGADTESNAKLLCLYCHAKAHVILETQNVGHRSASIVLARLARTKGRWK